MSLFHILLLKYLEFHCRTSGGLYWITSRDIIGDGVSATYYWITNNLTV